MMTDMNDDVTLACTDLVGRTGARNFDIGYLHDDVPVEETGWYATAYYQGARISTDGHRSPSTAAMALAERLLGGATCRCREPVTLSDGRPDCRWRLAGKRWEPGCDVPSVRVEGARGDYAAMARALAEQPTPANRRERRTQRKGSARP